MNPFTPFPPFNHSLLLLFCSFCCCAQPNAYAPAGLEKVSDDRRIEIARARVQLDMEKVVITDSLGNRMSLEEASSLDYAQYFGDYFMNKEEQIVHMVIRRMTDDDRILAARLIDIYNEGEPIEVIDVNCADTRKILEEVHDRDQNNRANKQIDESVDRANQSQVVSIIEKCGWPLKAQVGQKGMQAVFLVIQHASKKLQEKYFPLIKASADRGDLSLGSVAMMEDRILMQSGRKQKYGSQLTRTGSGPWQLYPIEDPANVNQRRAAMGLEPLEAYLKRFGIE